MALCCSGAKQEPSEGLGFFLIIIIFSFKETVLEEKPYRCGPGQPSVHTPA